MLRAQWHRRTTLLPILWLVIAGFVAITGVETDHIGWLLIHTILLGAITNAIFIWSRHFAVVLLFLPDRNAHRDETWRLGILNFGVVSVLIGEITEDSRILTLGAAAAAVAVILHAVSIIRALMRAVPTRFRSAVFAYVAASIMLIAGIAIGWWLSVHNLDEEDESAWIMAHLTLNLLGWVGITIMATIMTLGPTMLRTKLAVDAERKGKRALPALVLGTLIAAVGYTSQQHWIAVTGLFLYLAGCWLTFDPLITSLRQRSATSFATLSAVMAMAWIAISIMALAVLTITKGSEIHENLGALAAPAIYGGVVQLVIGTLSYLIPAMAGGGPAAVRARNAVVDKHLRIRLVLVNVMTLMFAVGPAPLQSPSKAIASAVTIWSAILILVSARNSERDELEG